MHPFNLVTIVFVSLSLTVLAHDELEDQLPLGYVKYPYQAAYPGDGEGNK